MRVVTQTNHVRQMVDVYVEVGPTHWLTRDGIVDVVQGGEPPVYVSLPGWVADALSLELEGRTEPASNRHLDDTIKTRDRLLALVEQGFTAQLRGGV